MIQSSAFSNPYFINSCQSTVFRLRSSVLFILLFAFSSIYSQTKTLEVCSSCEYKSIKNAISFANDGDTVLIKKGNYKETDIQISKAISIIGEDNPVIDGQDKKTNIFYCNTENFSISGLSFKNVGMSYVNEFAAIFVFKSKNFTLKNNNFSSVFYSFIIQDSSYGKIVNNKVTGTMEDETKAGNGVHIWKAKRMHIENNEITNMRDGIYLEYVQHSTITNNKSINNIRYGLHFMFSHDNVYDYNEFKGNGAGVAVMYSKRVEMYHNNFHHNWGTASYGLLLKEIYDSEIENNTFQDNTIGINLDGCNRISYKKNNFIGNGWAVKFIGACYENSFTQNNFLSNAFDLSYSSKLNDNSFDGNHWSEYTGYDLDHNGIGDVSYRPVKLFSYIVNKSPDALVLLRSLFVDVLNFSEKVSPVFTPDKLIDSKPIIKRIKIDD